LRWLAEAEGGMVHGRVLTRRSGAVAAVVAALLLAATGALTAVVAPPASAAAWPGGSTSRVLVTVTEPAGVARSDYPVEISPFSPNGFTPDQASSLIVTSTDAVTFYGM
jgi:hypothetical protein